MVLNEYTFHRLTDQADRLVDMGESCRTEVIYTIRKEYLIVRLCRLQGQHQTGSITCSDDVVTGFIEGRYLLQVIHLDSVYVTTVREGESERSGRTGIAEHTFVSVCSYRQSERFSDRIAIRVHASECAGIAVFAERQTNEGVSGYLNRNRAIGAELPSVLCSIIRTAGDGDEFMILRIERALGQVVVEDLTYFCYLDIRCMGIEFEALDNGRSFCHFEGIRLRRSEPTAESLTCWYGYVRNAISIYQSRTAVHDLAT